MKLEKRGSFGWPATAAGYGPCRNGLVLHYDGSNQGLAKKSHQACRAYWISTRKFHMGPSRGWADIGYCVDEETEILTENGWKTFHQVRPGDVVMTLNHESGMSEWQPIQDVHIFPAMPREMVRMRGRQHSSLTTPDHRWPVERFLPQGRERAWATTDTLMYQDRIPIAAECADFPTEPKWSDAFVEAIAWFWTERHIKPQSTSLAIYQQEGANAVRIRAALRNLFGPPADGFPRTDGVPRWREAVNTNGGRHLVEFHLSTDAGRILLEQAPNRVVRYDFLRSLTRAQLDLFVNISSLADGTVTWRQMAKAEAFQFAATLAGRATSLRQAESGTWVVHLHHLTAFSPRRGTTFEITRERYEGHVWCVRTPNSTWLARRAGTVYFTGNSFAVCPHGVVMEGRGWQKQQAAQPGGNSTWTSCTFMSGDAEKPTTAQINAFKELRAWLRGKGLAAAIKGHRDFIATSCPGGTLYSMVKSGALTGASKPAPKPPQEERMQTVVDLGALQPQTVTAGQRRSLAFEVEYADPAKVHTDAKDGTRYPSVMPKGGDAPYAVTVEVVLADRPGPDVTLTIAQYARNADDHERDIRGIELLGARSVLHSNIRMSDRHKYRADIINDSAADVVVERAYLLIAR